MSDRTKQAKSPKSSQAEQDYETRLETDLPGADMVAMLDLAKELYGALRLAEAFFPQQVSNDLQ